MQKLFTSMNILQTCKLVKFASEAKQASFYDEAKIYERTAA